MAQANSFYQYIYDWQNTQHDTWFLSLLRSCHQIMHCTVPEDTCEFISQIMLQLKMDGYFRLETCNQVTIEHFQAGKHASYHGDKPQKGSNIRTIKVVELEHALIFKMQFIQLYLSKYQENSIVLDRHKDIWLLWLMHVESVCLQASIHAFTRKTLSAEQQMFAQRLNYHDDLKKNVAHLQQQTYEMTQTFIEQVMPLIPPTDILCSNQQQALLIDALRGHEKKLSQLIKQQYGLYLSTERILQGIEQR